MEENTGRPQDETDQETSEWLQSERTRGLSERWSVEHSWLDITELSGPRFQERIFLTTDRMTQLGCSLEEISSALSAG